MNNARTVHIRNFGCQMNKLDTALVTAALTDAGFGLTDSVKDADVVLINTCSVREHAEARVLSHLGHLKYLKRQRPNMVVAVMGCMAQRLGASLLAHGAVNVVCGPTEIPRLVDLIDEALDRNAKQLAVTAEIRCEDTSRSDSLERFESAYGRDGGDDGSAPGQAFVRVMRGCDNFCTYCIVPHVRGPEVCRSPQAILEQVRRLAQQGVKQVTFLGQTVNAYEYRAGEKTYCLADLLAMATQVEGIEWLRFVTSYPSAEHYDEILAVMASSEKVCPYLHIPAQSGSDRILRAMNRRYTAAQTSVCSTAPGMPSRVSPWPGISSSGFRGRRTRISRPRWTWCERRNTGIVSSSNTRRAPGRLPTGDIEILCRPTSSSGATSRCWRSKSRSVRR